MRSAHPEARPESSNSFGIRVKGFLITLESKLHLV